MGCRLKNACLNHGRKSTSVPMKSPVTVEEPTEAKIEFTSTIGTVTTVLKAEHPSSRWRDHRRHALNTKTPAVAFLEEEIADAKAQGVLFSLHMKATMMKVSDPIIFGHCVKVFFQRSYFDKHAATYRRTRAWTSETALGDLSLQSLDSLPAEKKAEIRSRPSSRLRQRPRPCDGRL